MRIGIDLGGTKIEIIALDDHGGERLRRRVATPAGDYAATLRAVAALVTAAEAELGKAGTVGVATPGAVSPASGLLKNSNSVCLNGRPLKADLEALLGREIRLENDANCFALSEASDGAAAGANTVFGVILGTGVGGGLVIHGRVLRGANAIAGEWGHNPLPWPGPDELPGPACYCGRRGCVETFLSGPGLSADFASAGSDPGQQSEIPGRKVAGIARPPVAASRQCSAVEIAELAARGDPAAEAALMRYEDRLARGLAAVINVLDPDVIVLGGGLSKLARLYTHIPQLWSPYVFSDRVDTQLVPPRHGDSSGVRGAAWLWGTDGR